MQEPNAYDFASGKADQTIRMATDRTNDAKEKAFDGYEGVKLKAYETYSSAKHNMNEQVKDKYETAKEKASEATGKVGAKMRSGGKEL